MAGIRLPDNIGLTQLTNQSDVVCISALDGGVHQTRASDFLYEPRACAGDETELQSLSGADVQGAAFIDPACVQAAIVAVLKPKSYPCVPALLSLQNREYMVGIYYEIGTGQFAEDLLRDLLYFRKTQKESGKLYLSFWAVFGGPVPIDEKQFEDALWRELSELSAAEGPEKNWDANFSSNPADKNFCLSIAGEAFFVVGLQPGASRAARRFPWPSIVFNLYEQFEELDRIGKYNSTVKLNRHREIKFAGSLNPVVEQFGDKWEAIQFSGKENDSNWKCPFAHGSHSKPENSLEEKI